VFLNILFTTKIRGKMAIKCPRCQTDNPDNQKFCGECATPLYFLGDIQVTETMEAPKEPFKRPKIRYGSLIIYTGLKEKDRAFEWLEKAYTEHYEVLSFLEIVPFLDPLRDDPRFAELLKRSV
jgi:hypothetical protein